SPAPLILVSKTRGVAWTKMQAPGAYLSSISCPDESRCYAVSAVSGAGGTGVISTSDGGANWSGNQSMIGQSLNAIDCPEPAACIAAGAENVPGGGFSGTLFVTNDGSNWAPAADPVAGANFSAVSCLRLNSCRAAGTSGDIYPDGGGIVFSTAGAEPEVTVGAFDLKVWEGDTASANAGVEIRLSDPVAHDVSVDYSTADGAAVSGMDYQARSGRITFKPGQVSRTVVVPIKGDSVAEPDEAFSVALFDPEGAGLGAGRATVTILDDDAGPTLRVSVADDEKEGTGPSASAAVTSGGRFVAFYSEAANLVPFDTNNFGDIFVRDIQTDSTQRVSLTNGGDQAYGPSSGPDITPDGRYVVFQSSAPNLVGDDSGLTQVFRHDRETGDTALVSAARPGDRPDGESTAPSVSNDGRFVAFRSSAANLVEADSPGSVDVFVRDMQEGTTSLVSAAASGAPANAASGAPRISGDGKSVAFWSAASD
ncbi:MAG: Calx-beta domain-containing protein, partial [Actinomycetota bacterium]